MNLPRGGVAGDGGGGGDQGAHAVGEAFQVIVEAVAKMQVDMLRMNVKVGRTEEAAQLMMMGLRVHQKRVERMEGRLEVVERKLPASSRDGEQTGPSSGDAPLTEGALAEAKGEAMRAEVSVQASLGALSESARRLMASMEPPHPTCSSGKLPCTKSSKLSTSSRNTPVRARSTATPSPPSSQPPPRAATVASPRARSRTASSASASGASSRACACSSSRACACASPVALAVAAAAADKRQEALGAALLKAAQEGSAGDVRALLRRGADVDFHNASRWTPLHMATRRARADVVALLARKGANVNARTSYGYTAAHMAAHHDFSGRCVHALAAAGANVNGRNKFGRTPLHLAAECGNELAVMRLLMAGAHKSARNDEGKTPLDVAKTEAVRDLLNA